MAIPDISVRHPRPDDIVDDPIEVAGVGTGFEGTLVARLRNATGQEIEKRSFQAGGTGIWGSFFFRIDVPGIPNRPRGTLEVFEESAKDGSEMFKRVVPILFGRALQNPYHGFAVYTVQSGDTLSSIAQEFYGDPDRSRTISRPTATSSTTPTRSSPDRSCASPSDARPREASTHRRLRSHIPARERCSSRIATVRRPGRYVLAHLTLARLGGRGGCGVRSAGSRPAPDYAGWVPGRPASTTKVAAVATADCRSAGLSMTRRRAVHCSAVTSSTM